MAVFEKYLSVWIFLAMIAGVALGSFAPGVVELIARAEFASVNIVVAALIWAMIYPMMIGVDPRALKDVTRQPKGLLITIVVNWLIKPFSMAALAVLFFEVIFAPFVSPEDASQYIAGLILLGAAPCTAMVFVWSQLTKGDEAYTLLQVSVNDVIGICLCADCGVSVGRDRYCGALGNACSVCVPVCCLAAFGGLGHAGHIGR